ncbi:uncharacterized protein LAESUDRAFT_49493 [Laetiporus sulphureus 93-53]|uniref:Uncharacterized protein n=1 Tax=Laetiporus sulphureus 93-53 TaxID=1314785 RepID=A0A165FAP6_9APHY|nr:uncharacterized protein LAESUDRAFT_49493 [Laetiporus sulphureus 93-53]KZT08683.1 hypothetical protein LAESUDRAFT_49493 [Laetiporus sulphureus 93-53]
MLARLLLLQPTYHTLSHLKSRYSPRLPSTITAILSYFVRVCFRHVGIMASNAMCTRVMNLLGDIAAFLRHTIRLELLFWICVLSLGMARLLAVAVSAASRAHDRMNVRMAFRIAHRGNRSGEASIAGWMGLKDLSQFVHLMPPLWLVPHRPGTSAPPGNAACCPASVPGNGTMCILPAGGSRRILRTTALAASSILAICSSVLRRGIKSE